MAKIPETGPVTIAEIAAEFQGPEDLAELSKKSPLYMSGTEEVSVDDFRGTALNGMQVSGGNQIYDQGDYRYHKFTSNGTLTVVASTTAVSDEYLNIECLMVGGGGSSNGSAYGTTYHPGGGGAGGFITATVKGTSGSHSVVVGGASLGQANNGGDSSASGFGSAKGGGNGRTGGGNAGGSGAGASVDYNKTYSGAASTGGGNRGGNSTNDSQQVRGVGGGGGAGQAGSNASGADASGGKGGNGKAWVDGVTYAGGGGGGKVRTGSVAGYLGKGAPGGSGGGGRGGNDQEKGQGGTNGLGGGAGINAVQNAAGNLGGSGVVIFRYKPMPNATRSISPVTIDTPVIEGPPYAALPDYDPATHKPVAEQWVDPHQKEIGWTIVELTSEERAAYAEAMESNND